MRSSEEMVMINISHPIEQIFQTIMEQRYTRYPVYDPE